MKRTKKLFSVMLALILALTTAFMGAESAFAADTCLPENVQTAGSAMDDTDDSDMRAMAEPAVIPAANMNASGAVQPYKAGGYDRNNAWYIPISIPSGGSFIIRLLSTGDATVYLTDSSNAETANILDQISISKAKTEEDEFLFTPQVKKGGTYYLWFQTGSYSKIETYLTIQYAAALKSGSTTKLTSNKTYHASVAGSGYRYYKITTSGTRYLTISIPWGTSTSDTYNFKVKLLNSKKEKNLLKNTVTLTEKGRKNITYAGVPKGTYYVAVSTATETAYGINVKATKVSESSGSSKSSAKSISKGGSKSGIITATQSSSSGDWYKIVLGSSQTVNLDLITRSGGYSGGIKFSFYKKNSSKPSATAERYYGEPNGTWNLYTKGNNGKLAAGTYYIKVQKYGSGSGYYKLQWK